jgi:hypothetical protein
MTEVSLRFFNQWALFTLVLCVYFLLPPSAEYNHWGFDGTPSASECPSCTKCGNSFISMDFLLLKYCYFIVLQFSNTDYGLAAMFHQLSLPIRLLFWHSLCPLVSPTLFWLKITHRLIV